MLPQSHHARYEDGPNQIDTKVFSVKKSSTSMQKIGLVTEQFLGICKKMTYKDSYITVLLIACYWSALDQENSITLYVMEQLAISIFSAFNLLHVLQVTKIDRILIWKKRCSWWALLFEAPT